MKHKGDFKNLIRMALLTAPIMALYNVAPITLFLSSDIVIDQVSTRFSSSTPFRIILPFVFSTINASAIWLINIVLFLQIKVNWRYVVSLLLITGYAFTLYFLISSARPISTQVGSLKYYPFLATFANNAIVLILIDLVANRSRKSQLELEKVHLETLNVRSRLDQLRSQVKPHFLFNALYTLKLLIKHNKNVADDYITRLSSFLRVSFTEERNELNNVEEELKVLENFIELNKVRFPDSIQYANRLAKQTVSHGFLPIFTLQILAENAIKHNWLTPQKPLKIELSEKDGYLHFTNNIVPKFHQEEGTGTGTGLKNLAERSRLLSNSQLKIKKNEKRFEVVVKIVQNESNHP